MHNKNKRALLLIVCTFSYLILGALVFDALESENDEETRERLATQKLAMMKKYDFSPEDYKALEHVVLNETVHKAGHQWKFAGSFYFSTLVITTLGYGHSTPRTYGGKAFCILYAMAGIPLNLVMFQSIGERLNTLISYIIRKIRSWITGCNEVRVSPTQLILVSLSIGSLIIAVGTRENWSLFNAYYYCFITFSTIGFGDFVPLQQNEDLQESIGYVIFTLTFILFGLAIFSACVNLLVLRFMASNNTPERLHDEQYSRKVQLESLDPTAKPMLRSSLASLHQQHHYHKSAHYTNGDVKTPMSVGSIQNTLHCLICGKNRRAALDSLRKRPINYRVRRAPVLHINHLVNQADNQVAPVAQDSPNKLARNLINLSEPDESDEERVEYI